MTNRCMSTDHIVHAIYPHVPLTPTAHLSSVFGVIVVLYGQYVLPGQGDFAKEGVVARFEVAVIIVQRTT